MPTRHKGSAAETRALDSYIKLVRATETVSARVREQIAAFGLSETQFAVLEALHHLGPLRATELARKLLRSGANITTVIDNLIKSGLVERRECPNDRRGIYIHLTEAGDAAIRRTFPAVAGRITGLLAALEPAEQDELSRLTRKLGTLNSEFR
jgi:MarR family 2-MHQ and catechol resistance regulon transcriptional repressor